MNKVRLLEVEACRVETVIDKPIKKYKFTVMVIRKNDDGVDYISYDPINKQIFVKRDDGKVECYTSVVDMLLTEKAIIEGESNYV